jgi:hypothetical protein
MDIILVKSNLEKFRDTSLKGKQISGEKDLYAFLTEPKKLQKLEKMMQQLRMDLVDMIVKRLDASEKNL